MDLTEKVAEALRRNIDADHIDLKDENGVYGFIVSAEFRRKPALERQMMIQRALRDPDVRFTQKERQRVLTIAGLTPAEFAEIETSASNSSRD